MLNQKDRITAEGQQAAYEAAAAQYERDRNASMGTQQFNAQSQLQGDLANQAAGLTTGAKNLEAAGQHNALMGDIGLRGALANQGISLDVLKSNQGAENQAGQFNAAARQSADVTNQATQKDVGLANLQSWLKTQDLGANLGQQANIVNQNAYMDAATKNQGVELQAQLANQAALQDANKTNLGAAIGVQELGANQDLTAQQANQAAGLRAGEANLNAAQQTQQLARMSGLDAAKSNQGTRLTQNQALLDAAAREDQLRQQADQGNFTNQLNAMGQETNSALAANTIGQSRADLQRLAQATEFQRLQQQMGAGATVDARTQSELDMAYQDFINQKNDPYQKLTWLSGLYSQQPQGYNQEQVLFNRTNPVSQIGGLATAGLGAVSSYLNKKKGGMVKMPKTVNMKKQKTGDWMAA